MKYKVVLSTVRIFEPIFIAALQAIYSLSIDQFFLGNQFVSSNNDTTFAWYSNCGG